MFRIICSLTCAGLLLSSLAGTARAVLINIHGYDSSTYTFFNGTAREATFKYTDHQTSADLTLGGVPQSVTFSHGTFVTTGGGGDQNTVPVEQQLKVGNALHQLVKYDLVLTSTSSDVIVNWTLNSADPLHFQTSDGIVEVTDFGRTQSPLALNNTENVDYSAKFELISLGVPEPSSLTLLAMGVVATGCAVWIGRRRRLRRAE